MCLCYLTSGCWFKRDVRMLFLCIRDFWQNKLCKTNLQVNTFTGK